MAMMVIFLWKTLVFVSDKRWRCVNSKIKPLHREKEEQQMDLNQNLIFLVKIKNEIFQLLEEKEFLKDLEQTCDIFKQKHEGLSNKLDALLPLSFKITINFEEICNNSSNMTLIKEINN